MRWCELATVIVDVAAGSAGELIIRSRPNQDVAIDVEALPWTPSASFTILLVRNEAGLTATIVGSLSPRGWARWNVHMVSASLLWA